MTYVITQPCVDVKEGSCVDVCPVDCIRTNDDDTQFYIDPEVCIDCEACVFVCPVDAIFYEEEVPAQWRDFIRQNREYFATKSDEERKAFRTRIDRR